MRPALASASLALALWALPARSESDDLASAEKQLTDGEAELAAAGGTCVTMCKALQSMMNAADRICALSKEASTKGEEQKRCTDARAKVAEALARVRAACPDCNPGPPLAPSTAGPHEPTAKGSADVETKTLAAPGLLAGTEASTRSGRASPRVSMTVDPMRIFLPTLLVQLRFEKAITSRFSVALAGAYGSLATQGSNGRGRTSATMIGAEIRGYVAGRVDGIGLFVGAEIAHRNAALFLDDHLETKSFTLGLTAGPVVGVKLVTFGGFTLESRIGASYVIDDQRWSGEPRPKIVPNFGVGVGFTL